MISWNCLSCGAIVDLSATCSGCAKCWNCVQKCTGDCCIDCCEDLVLKMKCIWETHFKPQINALLDMEHGQYVALIAICHACEHAYKTLVCDRRDVMQDALEATFRLPDLLAHAREAQDIDLGGEPFKHWGKVRAHVLRELLLNPTKHSGRPKEGTALILDPNSAISSSSAWMSSEDSAIMEAGGTINLDISNHVENAYFHIRALMNGLDEAYSAFVNTGKAHVWFSPSKCGDDCDTCRKEMIREGIAVKRKPPDEEDRIRRQVKTEMASGRFYLSAMDNPVGIATGRNPSPPYEGHPNTILVQLCTSVVRNLQQEYREVKQENDRFNEPTPKLEIVLPNGEMHK